MRTERKRAVGDGLDRKPACAPRLWPLDPKIIFLNHGSFGSCPQVVLDYQDEVRAEMERQPVQFFVRELEGRLDAAREVLARFVGAEMEDLAFVPNATSGVNTVLRSLQFGPGDDLLVTDHEYNACRNALDVVAAASGARVVIARVPFPLRSADLVVEAVMERLTPRTRLVLLDHVTSQTGLVLPIARLVRGLRGLGICVLVDGAHAPGMVPLDLRRLGADYYTGNCHKWLCAPKGAAFLYVRKDRQGPIRPLTISHGANSPRRDRSRFLIEFGWTGTCDPSAWLSVPRAIKHMESLLPGGWPEIMRRNRALALSARTILCKSLGITAPCPDSLIGSLAAFPLPDGRDTTPPKSPLYLDPLQEQLLAERGIEVPVIPWPAPPKRLLRISAQLYNSLPQYEDLARALTDLLQPRRQSENPIPGRRRRQGGLPKSLDREGERPREPKLLWNARKIRAREDARPPNFGSGDTLRACEALGQHVREEAQLPLDNGPGKRGQSLLTSAPANSQTGSRNPDGGGVGEPAQPSGSGRTGSRKTIA